MTAPWWNVLPPPPVVPPAPLYTVRAMPCEHCRCIPVAADTARPVAHVRCCKCGDEMAR